MKRTVFTKEGWRRLAQEIVDNDAMSDFKPGDDVSYVLNKEILVNNLQDDPYKDQLYKVLSDGIGYYVNGIVLSVSTDGELAIIQNTGGDDHAYDALEVLKQGEWYVPVEQLQTL